jgi:hypothetical protein
MTTENHNNELNKLLGCYVIAVALFILGIMLFGIGCSPAQRIERKDNAAVNRVNANKKLQDKVFAQAAPLHPCKDSVVKYLPGKKDTLYLGEIDFAPEAESKDSLTKRIADSVRISFANDYQEGLLQAAKAGYDEAEAIYKKRIAAIKIPVQVTPDTVFEVDGNYKLACEMQISQLNEQVAHDAGVIKTMKEADKGKAKIPWLWLIAIIAASFGGGFLTSKFK